MKNGTLVTAMLDSHAETIRLMRSRVVEDVEAAGERIQADADHWFACLADGWTVAELDTAFTRRFGRARDGWVKRGG